MIYSCKIASECPRGEALCCFCCDHMDDCETACDCVEKAEGCPDREPMVEQLPMSFGERYPTPLKTITDIVIQQKKLEAQLKELKEAMVTAMEKHGVKKWENDEIRMTYVAETTQRRIDSTRLKKEHPDIAEAYMKESTVKAYVKVDVK